MKNKPRIRFKGFTEDWEQCKLGDNNTFFTDGNYGNDYPTANEMSDPVNGIPFLRGSNLDNGTIKLVDVNYITKQKHNLLTSGHTKFDDIIIAVRGSLGNCGYVAKQFIDININSQLAIIRTDKNELSGLFLIEYLLSSLGKKEINRNITGTALKQLPINSLKMINIKYPSIYEQEKISILLSKLNASITLHQRKLEKLKLAKKALLQKLFPKNGSQFPEIRFKGFTDAWEQCEFSDIFAEIKSGLSRMLSNDDIGLPVVRANNINDGQLNLVDDIKYWYKNDPQGANTNNYLIEQGDILINFINSEAKMGTAAYVTRKPERDTIYTTNILRCKVNDEYNPYFIYSLTFLNSYKNYIASITKPAVNQASFTTVDFKKYSTKIPIVKEQKQIADLIETFNKLITLHQRKLDKLQEVKKGLLQKMFV